MGIQQPPCDGWASLEQAFGKSKPVEVHLLWQGQYAAPCTQSVSRVPKFALWG